MSTPVILSYGMGVDSTAILLRWLTDPTSRDFELADLVVITAMTGDEFADTGRLVADHILPRLAQAGVRYVQVARNGHREADGYTVLSDAPGGDRVHLEGVWKLSDEMAAGGLVPQTAGARRCSMHFKGFVLDRWIADHVDGPFRHVIGFAAGEERRVAKDQAYGTTEGRAPEYPLITWGWDRAAAEAYITTVTGAEWTKSCCTFCPFARDMHLARYFDQPAAAVQAMAMEHTAVALNPTQLLFKDRSVVEAVEASGNAAATEAYRAHLATTEYSLYEVRRAILATRDDPTRKAPAVRSVRVVATGSAEEMQVAIEAEAAVRALSTQTDRHGVTRLVLVDRATLPIISHQYVVAPAGVADKERASFAAIYGRALAEAAPRGAPEPGQLPLFAA